MKILDDIFDRRFLDDLTHRLSHSAWYPNNIANRKTWPYGEVGSHRIFGEQFFERQSRDIIHYGSDVKLSHLLLDCFYAIERRVKKDLVIQEIAGNLQFPGMDGSNHRDTLGGRDDLFSYIMMLSSDPGEGGEFINVTTNQTVPFLHGRVIEITSEDIHRGMSFTTKDKIRFSVKFVATETLTNN